MNGIDFMKCVVFFENIYVKRHNFPILLSFYTHNAEWQKNSASRQLLVIPSDSVTRLIVFAGQNFNKLPPLF